MLSLTTTTLFMITRVPMIRFNSTIIDHEFKGHYKDGLVHVEGVSDPIFKKQKESNNWNNATQEYKDYFNKVIEEHGWK